MLWSFENEINFINVDLSILSNLLQQGHYPNLVKLGIYISSNDSINILVAENNSLQNFGSNIKELIVKSRKIFGTNSTFDPYDINKILDDREAIQDSFKACSTMFQNLKTLQFDLFIDKQSLTFDVKECISFSSIITELYVTVESSSDCLSILDGSFKQLKKLCIVICDVQDLPSTGHTNIDIPHLTCFSIAYKHQLSSFDHNLVQLLSRLTNSMELHMTFLKVNSTVDGHVLKQITENISTLQIFLFNIGSLVDHNGYNLPLNEHIQYSFLNFQNNQIISSVDYFARARLLYCHVYSLPYTWKYYHYITNNFRGGLFKTVREITLYDEHPFEHDFLLRIAQSFPFVTKLIIHNYSPQYNNHFEQAIIKYSHLVEINLVKTHDDYLEEFLNNEKTCLLHGLRLYVSYQSLARKTKNFTRDQTRTNCSKMIYLQLRHYKKDFDEDLQKSITIDFLFIRIKCEKKH